MSKAIKLLLLLLEQNDHLPLLLMACLSSHDLNPEMFYFPTNLKHRRIDGFNNEWIQLYLDHDFFNLFKMSKETFGKLWEKIDGPEFTRPYQGDGVPIAEPTELLMALWWLGKGEFLLIMAEKFDTAVSIVHSVTSTICNKILHLLALTINWPKTTEEFETLGEEFRSRCGYPGVIGAVDGTNIKFKAPVANQESYIDKNDCNSLKLQVIYTHKIFTNIVVGFPGSVHDARVFRNSVIYVDINENGQLGKYFLREEYHLIGDKAYPLANWIMKPYIWGDSHWNDRLRRFNYNHSKMRVVVKYSIGLLKGRWTILKSINVNSEKKAIKIIAVCCILYNFCYLNGDIWELEENPRNEDINNENGGVDNHA